MTTNFWRFQSVWEELCMRCPNDAVIGLWTHASKIPSRITSQINRRNVFVAFAIVLIAVWIRKSTLYQTDNDARRFKKNLQEFVETALKRKQMQAHINKLTFQHKPSQGREILDMLVEKSVENFNERALMVKRLKKAVEKSYSRLSATYPRCCDVGDFEFDQTFKQSVSKNKACEIVSWNSPYFPTRLTADFEEECMRNNEELPSIKWQYFGSLQGVTTVYPAMSKTKCNEYDSSLRPWYTQAIERHSKEVVIVINRGQSMKSTYWGVEYMEIAKDAAKFLISTLNPYDKLAVLATSEAEGHPTSSGEVIFKENCFPDTFIQATMKNKRDLVLCVENITTKGVVKHERLFTNAFDMLGNIYDTDNFVKREVHVISDGNVFLPTEEFFLKFKRKNQKMNNPVQIMTYGIGSGDFTMLKEVTKKLNSNSLKEGEFTEVRYSNQLQNQLASSYKTIAAREQNYTEPIWTAPYPDIWGLGPVITASLPVFLDYDLIGVVAIDTPVEDFFHERIYARQDDFIYAFVVDELGWVIRHPLLDHMFNKEFEFVDITSFEEDNEFESVLKSMKRRESGQKYFVSTKYRPRGDVKKYGVARSRVGMTYYWKQIPKTKLSICVVSFVSVKEILTPRYHMPSSSFLYHRTDLVPLRAPCNHFNKYATMEKTAVFFPSRAFIDDEYYYKHNFTKIDLVNITNYLSKGGPNILRLKSGIKEEVVATHAIQVLWGTENRDVLIQNDVVWRYVATLRGVFRISPGIKLPIHYDPTLQPWFQQSLAHRNKDIVITTPYLDKASGQVVVTMTQALYTGRKRAGRYSNIDEVFGIMGMDVEISRFNKLFLSWHSSCQLTETYSCYLIDNAGFIIVSTNIGQGEEDLKALYGSYIWKAHLTEFEPDISSILIRNRVIQRTGCLNEGTSELYLTYTISDFKTKYRKTVRTPANTVYKFELVRVPETNTFLLTKIFVSGDSAKEAFSCPCTHKDCVTEASEESSCECPCSVSLSSSQQQSYMASMRFYPPCKASESTMLPFDSEDHDLSQYPNCYNMPPTAKRRKAKYSVLCLVVVVGLLYALWYAARRFAISRIREKNCKCNVTCQLNGQRNSLEFEENSSIPRSIFSLNYCRLETSNSRCALSSNLSPYYSSQTDVHLAVQTTSDVRGQIYDDCHRALPKFVVSSYNDLHELYKIEENGFYRRPILTPSERIASLLQNQGTRCNQYSIFDTPSGRLVVCRSDSNVSVCSSSFDQNSKTQLNWGSHENLCPNFTTLNCITAAEKDSEDADESLSVNQCKVKSSHSIQNQPTYIVTYCDFKSSTAELPRDTPSGSSYQIQPSLPKPLQTCSGETDISLKVVPSQSVIEVKKDLSQKLCSIPSPIKYSKRIANPPSASLSKTSVEEKCHVASKSGNEKELERELLQDTNTSSRKKWDKSFIMKKPDAYWKNLPCDTCTLQSEKQEKKSPCRSAKESGLKQNSTESKLPVNAEMFEEKTDSCKLTKKSLKKSLLQKPSVVPTFKQAVGMKQNIVSKTSSPDELGMSKYNESFNHAIIPQQSSDNDVISSKAVKKKKQQLYKQENKNKILKKHSETTSLFPATISHCAKTEVEKKYGGPLSTTTGDKTTAENISKYSDGSIKRTWQTSIVNSIVTKEKSLHCTENTSKSNKNSELRKPQSQSKPVHAESNEVEKQLKQSNEDLHATVDVITKERKKKQENTSELTFASDSSNKNRRHGSLVENAATEQINLFELNNKSSSSDMLENEKNMNTSDLTVNLDVTDILQRVTSLLNEEEKGNYSNFAINIQPDGSNPANVHKLSNEVKEDPFQLSSNDFRIHDNENVSAHDPNRVIPVVLSSVTVKINEESDKKIDASQDNAQRNGTLTENEEKSQKILLVNDEISSYSVVTDRTTDQPIQASQVTSKNAVNAELKHEEYHNTEKEPSLAIVPSSDKTQDMLQMYQRNNIKDHSAKPVKPTFEKSTIHSKEDPEDLKQENILHKNVITKCELIPSNPSSHEIKESEKFGSIEKKLVECLREFKQAQCQEKQKSSVETNKVRAWFTGTNSDLQSGKSLYASQENQDCDYSVNEKLCSNIQQKHSANIFGFSVPCSQVQKSIELRPCHDGDKNGSFSEVIEKIGKPAEEEETTNVFSKDPDTAESEETKPLCEQLSIHIIDKVTTFMPDENTVALLCKDFLPNVSPIKLNEVGVDDDIDDPYEDSDSCIYPSSGSSVAPDQYEQCENVGINFAAKLCLEKEAPQDRENMTTLSEGTGTSYEETSQAKYETCGIKPLETKNSAFSFAKSSKLPTCCDSSTIQPLQDLLTQSDIDAFKEVAKEFHDVIDVPVPNTDDDTDCSEIDEPAAQVDEMFMKLFEEPLALQPSEATFVLSSSSAATGQFTFHGNAQEHILVENQNSDITDDALKRTGHLSEANTPVYTPEDD